MRKNEKVMRFRSGEQVGQRFLVVSNPLFCSFKFVNAQQTSASFSWPVFFFWSPGPRDAARDRRRYNLEIQ